MGATIVQRTVRDFMTPAPAVVDGTDSIATVARLFEQHDISGAPVIGARGQVVGVVSKTDLIRHVLKWGDERPPRFLFQTLEEDLEIGDMPEEIRTVLVEDVMSGDPITAQPGESVAAVAARMREAHVHRAIVVDSDSCPIGIVTAMDLLKALVD